MNSVNKTLYIPLYGKSYVSKKGLFLKDAKAEQIWEAEGFALKGKAKSKWLAYYMGIRAAVFDDWVRQQMARSENAAVIHLGCGMDSRVLRVGTGNCKWYDVDFPEVILQREKHYRESSDYQMIPGDIRNRAWLERIPERGQAIVIMEGVSMYMTPREVRSLTENLCAHFENVVLLMDCYTTLAARMSKYKNPINQVGVTEVYGIDDPASLQWNGFVFAEEHDMTPDKYINELTGTQRFIFRKLYAGSFAKKLYRMYAYKKLENSSFFEEKV